MDYTEYSIAQISTLKYGKMLSRNKMVSEGFPVYSGYRVTGYASHYMYEEPMLVVVARGVGGTGDVKISPAKSWITNLSIVLDVDTKKVDKYYLCMFLGMERLKEKLDSGAAQSQITISSLEPYRIRLPSIRNQKLVAGIIRTYDDLIENNTRRIKILEEMAQTIYREWFVKFRFPGHEKVKMIDSSLGKIPEGWEVVNYSDLIGHSIGGDWGKEEPTDTYNQSVTIIRGTDFGDVKNGGELRTPHRFIKESSIKNRQLKIGDIVVENSVNANSRCVGKTLLITEDLLKRTGNKTICASFCKLFRPNESSMSPLIHLHMKYLHEEGKMHFYNNVAANGIGNFQSTRFLKSEAIAIPLDRELLDRMLNTLADLTSTAFSGLIYNLRQTRDLLLPKLISGEIDVSELDIETGAGE